MRKLLRFITLIFLLYVGSVSAHDCASDVLEQSIMKSYPNYASDRIKQETFTTNYRNRNVSRMLNFGCQPTATMYTIPIVVHIVHNGEPIGTGSNLTDAQVQASIDGMNLYVQSLGVKYVLARQDPNGNFTTGIIRVNGSAIPNYTNLGIDPSTSPTGAPDTTIKKLSIWPWADYVNVWLVNKVTINAAYANMPSAYAFQGIVIPAGSLLLTTGPEVFAHEMGHYFNLFHTFQGSSGSTCAPNSDPYTQGDKCGDTPPVLVSDNETTSSCGIFPNIFNSTHNFMSYCLNPTLFTPDQRDRVQAAVLGQYRWSLVSSHGLIPTSGTITEIALDSLFFNQDLSLPLCNGLLTPVIQIKNLGTVRIDSLMVRVQSGLVDTTVSVYPGLLRGGVQFFPLASVKVLASGSYNVHVSIERINRSDSDYNVFNNELCTDVSVIVQSVTITTLMDNPSAGTISGSGTFSCNGAPDTIRVTTNPGYVFQSIKQGNTVVSTSPVFPTSIDLSAGNKTYTAYHVAQIFTVAATANPTNGGTVTSGIGTYSYGSTPTVIFKAKAGYQLVNVTENANIISTDSSVTLPALNSNRNLVGNFALKTFAVNVSVNGTGGSVSGGGPSIAYGSPATVVATSYSCFDFVGWYENGVLVFTSKTYTFNVTGARNLVAKFTPKRYQIATVSNNTALGTVSSGDTYDCGTTIVVYAYRKPDVRFINWTDQYGNVVSTDTGYRFQVDINRVLIANFVAINVSAGSDKSICIGSSTTLTGSNASSYSWNTGVSTQSITVSPTTTTTYVVTGLNGTKDTVVVFVKPLPNVGFTKSVDGNKVQFTAPGGNTTYSWDFGDNESSVEQNPLHTYATNGKKYVTLQATLNGCSNQQIDSVAINNIATGIINNTSEVESKIYPNPTSSFLKIEIKSLDTYNAKIYNIVGDLLWSDDMVKQVTVDVSGFSKGIYILKLDDGKTIISKQFLVQ